MVKRVCGWEYPSEWSEWCAQLAAVLDARHRWRLPVLMAGMLFASGRRTVSTWLRAAGVSADYADYYYFLASVGRKSESLATQLAGLVLRTLPLPERLLAVIDDSPTKRYGPKVEGADIHHNPTPGPADQKYLYGHIWVTLSLSVRHPLWGAGQQQVRNIWTNVAVFQCCLWMHTLVELWAWNRSHDTLCDRTDSPWDDAERRPSHANRRKALRALVRQNELSTITAQWWLPPKILRLAERLMGLAA